MLAPLVGLLVKLFLTSTTDGVLTDTGIVTFVLHPLGFTVMLIVGAVSGGVLFAEQGVLMVIGFATIEERRVTYLEAMIYVARRATTLVQLAGHLLVRLLLIAAPFLAGVGAIYWILLRRYDINFYLTNRPAEYLWAIGLAGLLIGGLPRLLPKRA